MKRNEIINKLNDRYEDKFVFEITDDETSIVGFLDDSTFKNIVAVIEPTESEMDKLITHIDKHI